jgi:hypothetical protein
MVFPKQSSENPVGKSRGRSPIKTIFCKKNNGTEMIFSKFLRAFRRGDAYASNFSSALREATKDLSREMRNRFDVRAKKKNLIGQKAILNENK